MTPGGTFIDANTADIQTIQPFLPKTKTHSAVVSLVFDGLVGGDVRTGQTGPNRSG